jgi:hypothetical protein
MAAKATGRDSAAREAMARRAAPAGAQQCQPGEPALRNPRQSGGLAHAPDVCLSRLEGLAEVLAHHGLRASLTALPGTAPSLHVVNPEASVLAEDVYARGGQDGGCWFWWSWAERITAGEDLEGAAARISRVLAARA